MEKPTPSNPSRNRRAGRGSEVGSASEDRKHAGSRSRSTGQQFHHQAFLNTHQSLRISQHSYQTKYKSIIKVSIILMVTVYALSQFFAKENYDTSVEQVTKTELSRTGENEQLAKSVLKKAVADRIDNSTHGNNNKNKIKKSHKPQSDTRSLPYWEEIIPSNDLTTQYYLIHDWKKHIEKTQEYQEKHGIDSIRKYITAYIEPWYIFNDTIPGTGSRGDLQNESDVGEPPQFVIPLPLRTHTPNDLKKYIYKHAATSCTDIPSKLPIDRGLELDPISGEPIVWNVGDEPTPPNFPWEEAHFCPSEADPFLPWIHDLFPEVPINVADDGTNNKKSTKIRFIAQNKRMCRTGSKFTENVNRLVPQVTLFQSVSVRRISEQTAEKLASSLWKPSENTTNEEKGKKEHTVRYRLAPYEDSDHDGMYTRFICQFRTSLYDINDDSSPVQHDVLLGETLSVYPFNYEMVSYRKGSSALLTPKGKDTNLFWASNLQFDCPIPEQLQDVIGSEISILPENAIPTIHMDLIPIRTSVRYEELYLTEDLVGPVSDWSLPVFDARTSWGNNNVLPRIEASGRWTNLPVCFPPQVPATKEGSQVGKHSTTESFVGTERLQRQAKEAEVGSTGVGNLQEMEEISKRNYLSACLWASSEFRTRGRKSQPDTGSMDRLAEWIEYHLLAGFDHVYLYDNSGANTNETTLQPIVDMFHPSEVTRIDWPSIICNNNVGHHDSIGERSSQYAAESSCRSRYAPYTEWIATFDIDEYLIPMGNYTDMKVFLRDAAKGGTNIVSLRSSRGRLRRDKSTLTTMNADELANEDGFEKLRESLYLEAYNCDSVGSPKPISFDYARKQIYRADYVLYHFVHYSTVTLGYVHTYKNATDTGLTWKRRYSESPPSERVSDEFNEAVMVHTKTLSLFMLSGWQRKCKYEFGKSKRGCWAAVPWHINSTLGQNRNNQNQIPYDENGYEFNCYINPKVEQYWVPKLRQAIEKRKNVRTVGSWTYSS